MKSTKREDADLPEWDTPGTPVDPELGLNGQPFPSATELAEQDRWLVENWPLPKASGKCRGCGKRLRVYEWCPTCMKQEHRRLEREASSLARMYALSAETLRERTEENNELTTRLHAVTLDSLVLTENQCPEPAAHEQCYCQDGRTCWKHRTVHIADEALNPPP